MASSRPSPAQSLQTDLVYSASDPSTSLPLSSLSGSWTSLDASAVSSSAIDTLEASSWAFSETSSPAQFSGSSIQSGGIDPSTASDTSISSETSTQFPSSTIEESDFAVSTTSGCPTGSATPLSCPCSDGTIYTDETGEQYRITCGMRPMPRGATSRSTNATTGEQCVEDCVWMVVPIWSCLELR